MVYPTNRYNDQTVNPWMAETNQKYHYQNNKTYTKLNQKHEKNKPKINNFKNVTITQLIIEYI